MTYDTALDTIHALISNTNYDIGPIERAALEVSISCLHDKIKKLGLWQMRAASMLTKEQLDSLKNESK